MSKHVLIVDDDALMRRSTSFSVEQAGYRVSTAASAEDGLAIARRDPPDVILLDVGLPGMDGLEALRHFQKDADVPVIFVTARRRELDTVLALEMGGDAYITKPFSIDILLAQIKAVLRRSRRATAEVEPAVLTVGDLFIEPAAREVTLKGRPLELAAREFDVLHVLALNAGKVVSVDDLLSRVWGAEFAGEPQSVYVHIRWLREKLEDDPNRPQRIVTVRGVGYKLVPQQMDELRG